MTEISEPTTSSGTSRRAIVAGVGAAGVAGVLAACGGDSETPPSGSGNGNTAAPTPTGGAAPTTGAPADTVLAKKSEIPVGGGKFNEDEVVVVVQPTAGNFAAYSAMCTHQQCVLTSVSNNLINCGCHGSQFSAVDGSAKKGPATKALEKRQITVDGDNIKLA